MRKFLAQALPDFFGVSGKFSAAPVIDRAFDFTVKCSALMTRDNYNSVLYDMHSAVRVRATGSILDSFGILTCLKLAIFEQFSCMTFNIIS
jgi:hypothetical protein